MLPPWLRTTRPVPASCAAIACAAWLGRYAPSKAGVDTPSWRASFGVVVVAAPAATLSGRCGPVSATAVGAASAASTGSTEAALHTRETAIVKPRLFISEM
ncbi:hypothetical protein ASF04_13205 [Duganella sp. Leaf61]|nr:hypothetical protein ASF04_13205 [Duganella sp. Leaf61]